MKAYLYIKKYFRHSKHRRSLTRQRMERVVVIDSVDELDVYLDAIAKGE